MATASPVSDADPAFEELAVVTLRSLVSTRDGPLNPGAIGTVVYRHGAADVYEVEFAEPVAAVVTLRGRDLAATA